MNYWDSQVSELGVWAEPDFEEGIEHCLGYIEPAIREGIVLDLGCGIGRLSLVVAQRNPHTTVIGLDSSLSMLEEASRRGNLPNLRYVCGDGLNVPPIGRVQGAYSVLLFQHLPSWRCAAYVNQIATFLDGTFVFQYVEGELESPNAYERPRAVVETWLRGLRSEWTDDSRFPNWRWVTCTSSG